MSTETKTPEMSQIIAKACTDENFKARFIADPAAVLKASGLNIPQGLEIKVVENTDKIFHLVLPARPAELSDDDLDNVTGGSAIMDPQYGALLEMTLAQQGFD